MAGITLAQAEARLQQYLDAEAKVLAGQRVSIDGQDLTRANLADIQAGIDAWNTRARSLSASTNGRTRMRTIAPGG